jgi:hypothetical protein
MKAQHIRPKVQNGSVARRAPRGESTAARPTVRRAVRSTARKAASAARPAPPSRRRVGVETPREPDSKVFWMIVFLGVMLTAGFLFGVRSQINTLQLNQAEEKLRDQIDRYTAEQKFLALDRQRALSPSSREMAVKESGLAPMKFDAQPRAFFLPAKLPVKAVAPAGASLQDAEPAPDPDEVAVNTPKPKLARAKSESTGKAKKAGKDRPAAGKQAEPRNNKNKAAKVSKPAAAKPPKARNDGGQPPKGKTNVRANGKAVRASLRRT